VFGYVKVGRLSVCGAPVHVNWAVLIAIGVLLVYSQGEGLQAITLILSYLGILFIHESGHALVANYLGYRPLNIYVGIFHGLCEYCLPYSRKHNAIIAWGGVLAQLAIAIPLIVLGQTTNISQLPGVGTVIVFLGYISAMVAFVNLAPSPALDGGKAWALIPILIEDWHLARKRAGWQRKK